MQADYHSVYFNELEIKKEISFFSNGLSYVLQHDINKGYHKLFSKAEAIYTEPAWLHGYSEFGKRANVNQPSYDQYLKNIRSIIDELKIPSFVVMGKRMIKRLNPDIVTDVYLHNYKSVLGIWNHDKINASDNFNAAEIVCDMFGTVLDFSCGYGLVARIMTEKKKNFICSDINKKCIYYIANKYLGFE
jgi:2-polyprenyl-3-methyl-5-hydroxy-6-metoxy-1,4-benzoquinol methylase